MSEFDLEGFDEITRALQGLEDKVKRKLVRKAINRAARAIVKDARARVPKRSGLLAMSLGVRIKRKGKTWVAIIGPRKNFGGKKAEAARAGSRSAAKASPAHYAHLVEMGTAPHIIEPDNAKALAVLGASQPIYRVSHPGARPKPFLRPAFEMNRSRAFSIMSAVLREAIQ